MRTLFHKIEKRDAEALVSIVGAENAVLAGGDLEPYSHDETENLRFPPEIALRPGSTEEVSKILRYADERKIPVTPQSGRTSLCGGALPVKGGIALCMERMNKILEIDRENLFVVTQPGVVTKTLQDEVEKVGLFYGPDPASKESCMIGGNIGHNAGGPRALKYGVTRDWVYGLEVVLADGDVIRTGGKLLKNVTGYNLTHLFVGSEGTLGVVTEAILKLVPRPKMNKTVLAPFPTLVSAAQAVTKLFQAGIVPCAVEYMEAAAVQAAERLKGVKFPHSEGAAAMLLIEVDGNHEEVLDGEIEKIAEVCLEHGSSDVFLATDPSKREHVWGLRKVTGEAAKAGVVYREEDTVVPRMKLPDQVETIHDVAKKHGLRAVSYGHVGDGNLHANLIKPDDMDMEEFKKRLGPAAHDVFARTIAHGGQISGEHGVGHIQRGFLPLAFPPNYIDLLRSLKKLFDPNGILNPGKVLPD